MAGESAKTEARQDRTRVRRHHKLCWTAGEQGGRSVVWYSGLSDRTQFFISIAAGNHRGGRRGLPRGTAQ